MTRKQRRLTLIGLVGVVLAGALGLILTALDDSIVFFRTPSEIAERAPAPGTRLRIGGLVGEGTVVRGENATVTFQVTDTAQSIRVTYTGILPDLFREGQGVVAEGTLEPGGLFKADTVLAKHDETYMPKEVAAAIKDKGVWRGEEAK